MANIVWQFVINVFICCTISQVSVVFTSCDEIAMIIKVLIIKVIFFLEDFNFWLGIVEERIMNIIIIPPIKSR